MRARYRSFRSVAATSTTLELPALGRARRHAWMLAFIPSRSNASARANDAPRFRALAGRFPVLYFGRRTLVCTRELEEIGIEDRE
jgi:hypothetical protein